MKNILTILILLLNFRANSQPKNEIMVSGTSFYIPISNSFYLNPLLQPKYTYSHNFNDKLGFSLGFSFWNKNEHLFFSNGNPGIVYIKCPEIPCKSGLNRMINYNFFDIGANYSIYKSKNWKSNLLASISSASGINEITDSLIYPPASPDTYIYYSHNEKANYIGLSSQINLKRRIYFKNLYLGAEFKVSKFIHFKNVIYNYGFNISYEF